MEGEAIKIRMEGGTEGRDGGRIRGVDRGRGYTLSLPPLPGTACVTCPGKAHNSSKSPGNALWWGMG